MFVPLDEKMSINDYIEDTSLFYLIEDKRICSECIFDSGLRKWFFRQPSSELRSSECSYCEQEGSTISVEQLQRQILQFFELVRIEEVSPRNDGEWLLKETTPEDWMHVNLVGKLDDKVVEDFFQNAVDEWYCRYHWQLSTESEQWQSCWDLFCSHVYESDRDFHYSFEVSEDDCLQPDFVGPAELPDRACVALLKADAFSVELRNARFYRVRENRCSLAFEELTSAPKEFAGENRFSLKGESMFYGAPHSETSALEVGLSEGQEFTEGCFKTTRELVLLDLPRMKLPEGRFDPDWVDNYHIAEFLGNFAKDVSKPIAEEDKEFGYVPTQAFCRYIKDQGAANIAKHYQNYPIEHPFPLPISLVLEHSRIDGIRYQSSKNGKECVVLFCDKEESAECLSLEDAQHGIFRGLQSGGSID